MNYPIIIFLKEYLCIMDEIKTEYRLDVYLHKMGFAESRERAKRLILDKSVFVGGNLILILTIKQPLISEHQQEDLQTIC